MGMLGGQPAAVSRFFGVGLFSITNLIFIFESLSTLDSTFTSAAKLFGPEFAGLLEDGTPKPPQRASLTCAPCGLAHPIYADSARFQGIVHPPRLAWSSCLMLCQPLWLANWRVRAGTWPGAAW